MNKIFILALTLVLILSTLYIATKPGELREVSFGGKSLKVVEKEIETKSPKTQIETKEPVQQANSPKATPQNNIDEKIIEWRISQNLKEQQQIKTTSQPKKVTAPKVMPVKQEKVTIQTQTSKVEQKPKPQSKVQPQPKPQYKSQVLTPTKPKAQPKQKVLTAYEETIAWNQWHANVVNEFVRLSQSRNTALDPKKGTKVSFDFRVDKNGNVSDVRILVDNPSELYTAYQQFAPYIKALSKKSVLKFPAGTQRTVTTVSDSFILESGPTSQLNSSRYKDYETVKKYR